MAETKRLIRNVNEIKKAVDKSVEKRLTLGKAAGERKGERGKEGRRLGLLKKRLDKQLGFNIVRV